MQTAERQSGPCYKANAKARRGSTHVDRTARGARAGACTTHVRRGCCGGGELELGQAEGHGAAIGPRVRRARYWVGDSCGSIHDGRWRRVHRVYSVRGRTFAGLPTSPVVPSRSVPTRVQLLTRRALLAPRCFPTATIRSPRSHSSTQARANKA